MKRTSRAWWVALLLLAAAGTARAEPLVRESELGPVRASVSLTPGEPRIGDALTLEITARAEPGVEVLMPEFGEALDRFAIVDFAPSESIDADGLSVSVQRYTLQPARSGTASVPPILIEFVDRRDGREPAPPDRDAWELLTERLEFEVASVLADDAPLELRPARDPLPPRARPGPSPWPFAIAALVLAAAGAPLLWRAWGRWSAAARQRSAHEGATSALEALLARGLPGPDELDPFFVELSSIVRRYLEDRFELRSPELTTEEFLEVVSGSPDLSREHQRLLAAFLERADLVKFAHFVPETAQIEDSIAAARRFLDETRSLERLPSTSPPAEPARA